MSTTKRSLIIKLSVLVVAMYGFGFALVPFYDVFCALTGLGGRTSATAAEVVEAVDATRVVRVEFVASVGALAPWEFRPAVSHIDVHPGRLYETHFYARNLASRSLTAQAIPSVAPGQAAKYLKKTECFCFMPQAFDASESREMPLIFMIGPELPAHLDTLTLSYTLYASNINASERR